MATTASGVTIPGASPTTAPATPIQDHWNNLGLSLNGHLVAHVASVTARAAHVTALATDGYTPTAATPVFVWRADAAAGRQLEVTIDGTNWYPVFSDTTAPATFAAAGGSNASGAFGVGFAAIASSTYSQGVTFERINGVVYVDGLAVKSGTVTVGDVIAWLPAGFRPHVTADGNGRRRYVVKYGGDAFGCVEVCGDGKILAQTATGAGDNISLDGIVFPARG